MKFQEALEKLLGGIAVSLETTSGTTVIAPVDLDSTILDITVTEALSDQWREVYTEADYKKDVSALADIFARLTASGMSVVSNGEELREIEVVRDKGLNAFISNYNGKWTLK